MDCPNACSLVVVVAGLVVASLTLLIRWWTYRDRRDRDREEEDLDRIPGPGR